MNPMLWMELGDEGEGWTASRHATPTMLMPSPRRASNPPPTRGVRVLASDPASSRGRCETLVPQSPADLVEVGLSTRQDYLPASLYPQVPRSDEPCLKSSALNCAVHACGMPGYDMGSHSDEAQLDGASEAQLDGLDRDGAGLAREAHSDGDVLHPDAPRSASSNPRCSNIGGFTAGIHSRSKAEEEAHSFILASNVVEWSFEGHRHRAQSGGDRGVDKLQPIAQQGETGGETDGQNMRLAEAESRAETPRLAITQHTDTAEQSQHFKTVLQEIQHTSSVQQRC